MSLLTICQQAAPLIGVQKPLIVAAATDPTVMLLFALAQQEGEELARYGDWRVLRKEKTFTTVFAETQTDTPLPADLDAIIDQTVWNRSARRPLYGPVDAAQWQQWKAGSTFPVTDSFTLRGASWLMGPVPAAGQTISYEYRSAYWCQSSGGTAKAAWTADTDTALISERLMRLGIVWRFKKRRGLEWQSDHESYLNEVDGDLAADRPRKVIDLKNGGPPVRYPGITVPDGTWAVP